MDEIKAQEANGKGSASVSAEVLAERRLQVELDLHPRDAVFFEGFEEALIGYVERSGMDPVPLYDREKCLKILEGRGLPPEEALTYFEAKMLLTWKGGQTPAFATLF